MLGAVVHCAKISARFVKILKMRFGDEPVSAFPATLKNVDKIISVVIYCSYSFYSRYFFKGVFHAVSVQFVTVLCIL